LLGTFSASSALVRRPHQRERDHGREQLCIRGLDGILDRDEAGYAALGRDGEVVAFVTRGACEGADSPAPLAACSLRSSGSP
jgi:hypothetical protein